MLGRGVGRMTNVSFDQLGDFRSLRQRIDESCRARLVVAARLAPHFSEKSFDQDAGLQLVERSIYATHFRDLSFSDPLRVVAFNLAVVDATVDEVIASDMDPTLVPFIVSRITELGGYSLLNPDDTSARPRQYLGASKGAGYFFTPPSVAFEMARAAIGGRKSIARCIDPAAGAGALLAAVAVEAGVRGVEIDSMSAIESDPITAERLARVLKSLRQALGASWELDVECSDAVELLQDEQRTFDCIVMNPPYGRVKFLRNALTNAETRTSEASRSVDEQAEYWKARVSERADRYKKVSEGLGLGGGRQDYQRLFMGLSMARLASGGRMSCISPASWLGDSDSAPLRRKLMADRSLESVWLYPEDSGLFATVNQVTAVTVAERDREGDSFWFDVRSKDSPSNANDPYEIKFESIQSLDGARVRVPKVSHRMHDALEMLQSAPRLGEIQHLVNARGELDQSLNSACITEVPTALRLVRGDHIERFRVRDAGWSERASYVDVTKLSEEVRGDKRNDVGLVRLVGRQVSYMNKPRRLSWAFLDAPAVVGNSCNYLVIRDDSADLDEIWANLALLNSAVVEWYFRVFNSNNHVANYEIDDLPTCVNDESRTLLATAAKFLSGLYDQDEIDSSRASAMEDLLDGLVAFYFGLSAHQAMSVVEAIEKGRGHRVAGMVQWLADGGKPDGLVEGTGWYQHVEASLSAHDREVVSYIPQGGNWTSIPESVPSKRLEQIREMTRTRGGLVRTSYYGRLRPDQPSYTIATFYNRPGNGTNIPPWEDRVLTSREAARLQSFPDWYIFASKEGPVRKQIGNAVPPLLAYALGRQLHDSCETTCIDLFAGAGGLSLGFELAGLEVVGASDNDNRASATYKLNRWCESEPVPDSGRTLFLTRDLSIDSERSAVATAFRTKLGDRQLGVLAGGPPCQGFSHAGWRQPADKRNDLAAAFLEFVEDLKPQVAILENVEGLLSYDKGRVVRDLLASFRELGYEIGESPWILNAETFGVPQMRRRVFLVATQPGIELRKPEPIFQKCKGRREGASPQTLFETGLPYPPTVLDALYDLPRLGSEVHPATGPRDRRGVYELWAKGLLGVDEMLALFCEVSA